MEFGSAAWRARYTMDLHHLPNTICDLIRAVCRRRAYFLLRTHVENPRICVGTDNWRAITQSSDQSWASLSNAWQKTHHPVDVMQMQYRPRWLHVISDSARGADHHKHMTCTEKNARMMTSRLPEVVRLLPDNSNVLLQSLEIL
jgi:hypothetical protein